MKHKHIWEFQNTCGNCGYEEFWCIADICPAIKIVHGKEEKVYEKIVSHDKA